MPTTRATQTRSHPYAPSTTSASTAPTTSTSNTAASHPPPHPRRTLFQSTSTSHRRPPPAPPSIHSTSTSSTFIQSPSENPRDTDIIERDEYGNFSVPEPMSKKEMYSGSKDDDGEDEAGMGDGHGEGEGGGMGMGLGGERRRLMEMYWARKGVENTEEFGELKEVVWQRLREVVAGLEEDNWMFEREEGPPVMR